MIFSPVKLAILLITASVVATSGFIAQTPLSTNHRNVPSLTSVAMSSGQSPALSLDPSETAVVFIEYQNEFTTPGGALYDAVKDCMAATNTLYNSKALADEARSSGCTIIHVPIVFDEVRREEEKTTTATTIKFSHSYV